MSGMLVTLTDIRDVINNTDIKVVNKDSVIEKVSNDMKDVSNDRHQRCE